MTIATRPHRRAGSAWKSDPETRGLRIVDSRCRASGRVFDPELVQRRRWASLPLVDEHVAGVLQVRNPHLRRPEAARGQIAEAVEEGDGVAQTRRGSISKGNVVEARAPLGVGARDERLLEPRVAFVIDVR